jgi:hypothetical protein
MKAWARTDFGEAIQESKEDGTERGASTKGAARNQGGGEQRDQKRSIGEEGQVFLVDPRQLLELDEVDPAFAEFALREEGIRLAEAFRDGHLGEAGFAPGLNEPREEAFVRLVVAPVLGVHG